MEIKTHDDGRSHSRELWPDSEDWASRLWVIDYLMRIGRTTVRMAGIGGVETRWNQRVKGYARQLLEDTVRYMQAEGFAISMLFGIENFYIKFGFASCLAESHFRIKTRDAEAAAERARLYRTRPIAAADMPAVLELYNARNADRTGSIVRTPADFTKFQKGTWYGERPETLLWEDETGRLLGYAVWDKYPNAVKVAELDAWDDALFPTLLAAFAAQAVEKRCEDIAFYMPPDHPFGEFAQRYGVEWTVTYPRHGAGMMRILNQQPLFETLAPELERRLAASPLAGHMGALALETDLGTTTLHFADGRVTVGGDATAGVRLTLPQSALMQLVIGYRRARDVLNDPAVSLTGAGRPLLDALFPKGAPYPWLADHF